MKEPETPREWLLLALSDFGITIVADNGNTLDLEKEYSVEIEQNGVFRLTWRGKVVAPFQDLAELCHFIQMS
ncbi:MAG TPA: hypothetical protein PLM41_16450 [Saprospiraceae bacterium]|nr:hypothetical protein [Saprospiraceae bacterium]